MTSRVTPKTCSLREHAGAGHELCPGAECALWDEHGCLVENRALPLRRDLAEHLLELRLALESARAEEAATRGPRLLAKRLNLNRE